MTKGNAFLTMVEREVQKVLGDRMALQIQMDLDAATLAANHVFHMGPTRARAFEQAFSAALREIAEVTVADTADMTVVKDKLDARLLQIVGEENFDPWEERYDVVKGGLMDPKLLALEKLVNKYRDDVVPGLEAQVERLRRERDEILFACRMSTYPCDFCANRAYDGPGPICNDCELGNKWEWRGGAGG